MHSTGAVSTLAVDRLHGENNLRYDTHLALQLSGRTAADCDRHCMRRPAQWDVSRLRIGQARLCSVSFDLQK